MIAVEAAKSSRSRRTNVVDAGQRSAAPCSARLVTISVSGTGGGEIRHADEGRTRAGIRPMPVLDDARRAVRAASARRRPPRARRAAPPEDVRRADAAATRGRRSAPTADADRAAGTARATAIDRANPRDDIRARSAADARSRRRAQNLDEHAVGHAVAVRAATRLEQPQPRCRAEAFLKLVQQPALAGARLADDGDHRAGVCGSPRDARLQRRQLGLTADVRRQSRSRSRLPAASRCRSRRGRGTASPGPPANRARRRRTPPCACTAPTRRCVSGLTRRRRGSARTASAPGLRRRRADDVVAARPFVQTTGDDRSDVQTRLDAQASPAGSSAGSIASHARMQFERGANRAQLVVFVRRRHAEQRDDLVADRLVHEAAVPRERRPPRRRGHARPRAARRRARAIDERRIVRHDGDQHGRTAPLGGRHPLRIVDLHGRVHRCRFARRQQTARPRTATSTRSGRPAASRAPVESTRSMPAGTSGCDVAVSTGSACRMACSTASAVVAVERPRAGEHLVERPRPATRCRSGGRPRSPPPARGSCTAQCRSSSCGSGDVELVNLRNAEIEDLRRAVGQHDDVGRLDVAVHDAGVVRVLESARDLQRDRERFVEGETSASRSAPAASRLRTAASR